MVIAVLLVVVGPAGRPDHDQQHCYNHAPKVKPKAATAVVELLMMSMRMPETCWAVNKRQVINWRNFCIYLVDLFELYDDARTCSAFVFPIEVYMQLIIRNPDDGLEYEWKMLVTSNME